MDNSKTLDSLLKHAAATPEEGVEIDRLILRMFENPALISHLNGIGKKGNLTELDFDSLPDEVIDVVKALIGPIKVEVLTYNIGGRPHVGFRFNAAELCGKK